MTPENYTYPSGYATEWVFVGDVRTGWACLITEGIAVLTPIIERQEARYVVESDRYDIWGYRKTIGHYEYRLT